MSTLDKMLLTTIPTEDQPYVDQLRKFLNDKEELNRLEGIKESTDLDLYMALLMTLDDINIGFSPTTNYDMFSSIPSIAILIFGAVLNILMSKGILSARNTLTYRDSGGITVQDYDKYGRYLQFYNMIFQNYNRSVQNWKRSVNIENCYGGIHSEYAFLNNI